MLFSQKTYDFLKYVALILLPALGSLYFGLANVWTLPYAAEVVGTISVLDVFLGVILKLDADAFKKAQTK